MMENEQPKSEFEFLDMVYSMINFHKEPISIEEIKKKYKRELKINSIKDNKLQFIINKLVKDEKILIDSSNNYYINPLSKSSLGYYLQNLKDLKDEKENKRKNKKKERSNIYFKRLSAVFAFISILITIYYTEKDKRLNKTIEQLKKTVEKQKHTIDILNIKIDNKNIE